MWWRKTGPLKKIFFKREFLSLELLTTSWTRRQVWKKTQKTLNLSPFTWTKSSFLTICNRMGKNSLNSFDEKIENENVDCLWSVGWADSVWGRWPESREIWFPFRNSMTTSCSRSSSRSCFPEKSFPINQTDYD